ncbi:MAG TPA: aldo/keto reductase [Candidatus Eisenbacteria bacterium]|nr:aldo/keto reductase [Candidatus Eisenbacteria bacterium]
MTPDASVRLAGGGRVPLLGLGTWQLRGDTARRAVGWALEAGYRLLDTATAYGNEAEVGAAVRESGLPRESVFVTTKMPPENAGQERATLERSLEALGLAYVDLWLVHWPPGGTAGVGSWRAFVQAREQGLAHAIGVSNYSPAQIDELTAATGVTPAVNQVRWSPFLHRPATVEAHRERRVVLEGYSPFRAGRLDHPVIADVARRHGADRAQVVVRWHLQHGIVVIPKSARRERIRANADVAGLELTPDEMQALDALGPD